MIDNSIVPFLDTGEIVVKSPGRTCLFGDHQDYLELPVIACAIDRHITLRAKPNGEKRLFVDTPDIGGHRYIDIDRKGPVPRGDYFLAAMDILEHYGCVPNQGYDITITGNIAINAGTSSSSAVIVSWIQFLVTAYGCSATIDKEFISRIAYEAEVAFHGFPGGKMDQYSIGLGNVIYLETGDDLSYEVFDLNIPGLIVAESGIPKETTGVLGELKEKALLAIHRVKEKVPGFDIKGLTIQDFPQYVPYVNDGLRVYFEAAVRNHDITQRALEAFRKPKIDLEHIGKLMNAHHHILKDYLEITLPLIDRMVDGANAAGALGAKIVGSGRGGSIVVLSKAGEQQKIIDALMQAGARDAYAVHVDPGTHVVTANQNKSK